MKQKPSENELAKEIAFHVEQLTAEHIANGVPPEEARRRALVEFGGPTQVTESLRAVYRWALLDALALHLRSAFRSLRKAPGFSVTVIVTLALGVGANAAMFSILDAVVLRPLPYPASQQLVRMEQHRTDNASPTTLVAPARLEDWNRLNHTFTGLSGSYTDDLTETSGALPERLTQALVAPRFFSVLGVQPVLGRAFLPAEEHWGGPAAAILSYHFWQQRFGGDPGVLGKQLHTSLGNMTVVGVMPPSFAFPSREVDLWGPSAPDAPFARDRTSTWFAAVGRLKPGVTPQAGAADLAAVQRSLGQIYPNIDGKLSVSVQPLKATVVADAGQPLWILYGCVTLLLLLVCSNVAALLLARTADREHEIAIRFSLGAPRGTLVKQLLAEFALLAVAGSTLGLAVAGVVLRVFAHLAADLPRADEIAMNWRVAGYCLGCALATTLACGLYPALRGTRGRLAEALAAGARTHSGARTPLQWLLVGVQVALAVVLLTGSGLLLRSLHELGRVSSGFDASHVLMFRMTGNYGETIHMGQLLQRIETTLTTLRGMPGVEAAATDAMTPGLPAKYVSQYQLDGHKVTTRPVEAEGRLVSSGYLKTLSISLLAGQDCAAGSAGTELLVNRSFADRYTPGASPLGHTLQLADPGYPAPPARIVGMVADAREQGLNVAPEPTVYTCFSAPGPAPLFLVRTSGKPEAMMGSIRTRMHALEPARGVYGMAVLGDELDQANGTGRLRAGALSAFAALAVGLACMGLYGTLSYGARMRERELGVRLTLGATRAQVARLLLADGLRVAAWGAAAGIVGSLACARVMASLLYGVSPQDELTYVCVVALILAAAMLSCAAPALRAARLEPVEALRAG